MERLHLHPQNGSFGCNRTGSGSRAGAEEKNKMDADAIAAEAGVVAAAATAQMQKPVKAYRYPPLSLLKRGPRSVENQMRLLGKQR
mgnify:CR=1 FL=1